MRGSTQIVLAAAFALGVSLARADEVPAQTGQHSTCPARFQHDAGVLRKTLRTAAASPRQRGPDYARLEREQVRPLSTASDQAVCARLDDALRLTTEDQRTRLRSYFALGDHYVALLPRDRKTRPHSEFGSVVVFDRDMKFVVAWTM